MTYTEMNVVLPTLAPTAVARVNHQAWTDLCDGEVSVR